MLKICKCCEMQFETNYLQKLFCSENCRIASNTKACEYCFSAFYCKSSHQHRVKYCSKSCADSARRTEKVCEMCNQKYVTRLSNKERSRFCSLKCKETYYVEVKGRGSREIICEGCGKNFLAENNLVKKGKKFCSKDCYTKHQLKGFKGSHFLRHQHRRRENCKNAQGRHTRKQWNEKLSFFGNKCYLCGAQGKLQKDHRIPISRGGTNWISNIAPACGKCNLSKGAKTEKEYRNGAKSPLIFFPTLSFELRMPVLRLAP